MDERLKVAINMLQYQIDKDSDKILLIFDSEWSMGCYIHDVKNGPYDPDLENKILIAQENLYRNNGLTGLRFKCYQFMPRYRRR